MLKNYYFYKWRDILRELKDVTDLDLHLQECRAPEPQLCRAAQAQTAVLARYMCLRNALLTIAHHNLQVQKTAYMQTLADAVEKRIAELKNDLTKLECSNNRFFTNGLVACKLTPQDIGPTEITHLENNKIHDVIKDVFEKIRIKREKGSILSSSQDEEVAEKSLEEVLEEEEDDTKKGKVDFAQMYAVKEVIPPEILEMRYMVNLIKANEKTRKIIEVVIQSKQKRVIWEKELLGTLKPPAPIQIREKASALIKNVARAYFQYKRDRITKLKKEEMLQMRFLKKPDEITSENNEEEIAKVLEEANLYEMERQDVREQMKEAYLQRKRGDLIDDHKDFLRAWFQKWHNELRFFYDIPKNGGSVLILKEDVPEPHEWQERYEAYIIEKKANKNKTKHQLKQEKEQALKAEKLKKQLEKAMNKKKNKKVVPIGYTYPKSTTLEEVQKALEVYHREWDEYDFNETPDAKVKFVKERENNSMLEEVKMQTCLDVDPDMSLELKALWKALKYDYENIYEEPMPEKIVERKVKQKKNKKKKAPKLIAMDKPEVFLEILAEHGLLVQYQKHKFKDFAGDHNFAGNEIRCSNRLAQPLAGEFRHIWWNTCQDAKSGFRRILLLGPRGNGRSTSVHILASSLNAVLLEINPEEIQNRPLFSAAYLQLLMKSVVACLKTIRPLVIFIKNIQVVFPKKGQKEAKANARILNNNLIKKIFKVNKSENVIIIGSLSEPWLCRSGQIMKRFSEVLLVPDTTYSATDQLLNDWILSNRTIPPDFPTHSLAQVLRGLQYGFLKEALDNFLTGDRLIKIAAFGLTESEVFDFVMDSAEKVGGAWTDYDQYWSWYQENTPWGKKEISLIQEQKDLKEQLMKLEQKKKQKMDRNKKVENTSEPSSILEED